MGCKWRERICTLLTHFKTKKKGKLFLFVTGNRLLKVLVCSAGFVQWPKSAVFSGGNVD